MAVICGCGSERLKYRRCGDSGAMFSISERFRSTNGNFKFFHFMIWLKDLSSNFSSWRTRDTGFKRGATANSGAN